MLSSGRSVVNRIATEDKQQVHLARIQVLLERLEIRQLIDRFLLERCGEHHRLAVVFKKLIDRVNHGVHFRRLVVARDHDRLTLRPVQIRHQRLQEFRCRRAAAECRLQGRTKGATSEGFSGSR